MSLTLRSGEVIGFVGPNGAGKSTFMKLLLGIARPSAGSGSVLNLDIARDSAAVRDRVGYLPGDLGLYRNLSGLRFLRFALSFHRGADLERAVHLADRLDLPLERRIKAYSSGMRQKLGIIQALAVEAPVLLLDEPTKGLDPTSQALFLDILAEERAAGRSILLSSHILGEVDRACDRIVFIDRGRLVDDETIERIKDGFRRTLSVTFDDPAAADRIAAVPGVARCDRRVDDCLLHLDGPLGPTLAALAELGLESVEYNRPSLEDIYRHLYLQRSAESLE